MEELAKAPAAARTYLAGQDAMSGASLSPDQAQAVQLAVAAYNECGYCGAAHTTLGRGAGISDEDDLAELAEAGVDRRMLYEIIAFVGLKTLSNYVNHIAGTEVDPQFR